MYFCLCCKVTHQLSIETPKKVFNTGYILVNESKIPLGICLASDLKNKYLVNQPFKFVSSSQEMLV